MTQHQIIKRFFIELLIALNVFSYFLALYPDLSIILYVLVPLNFLSLLALINVRLNELKFLFFIFSVLLVFFFYGLNTEYIIIFSFSLLCIQVGYDRLLRLLWLFFLFFFLFFIIIRAPENIVYLRGGGSERYDLGFNNPNILSKYVFSFLVLTFLIKLRFTTLVMALIFYKISGTRTLLFTILLYPFLAVYFSRFAFNKSIIRLPAYFIFPFLTVLSFYLAEFSKEYVYIDFLLSFRPMHWVNYLESYPISFVGHRWGALEQFALDNSFLQILVRLGVVGVILLSVFYYYIYRFLFRAGNVELLIVVTATMIYSVFENMLKFPLFNIATVLTMSYIHSVNFERSKNVF